MNTWAPRGAHFRKRPFKGRRRTNSSMGAGQPCEGPDLTTIFISDGEYYAFSMICTSVRVLLLWE